MALQPSWPRFMRTMGPEEEKQRSREKTPSREVSPVADGGFEASDTRRHRVERSPKIVEDFAIKGGH